MGAVNEYFSALYGVDQVKTDGDLDLLYYWATPGAKEIANYIWDTDVPEVTKSWPCMEYVSVRDALESITGTRDVTGFLYSLKELEVYGASQDAEVLRKCEYCGTHGCEDKFCGLHGDDTEVIESADPGQHVQ